MKKRLSHFPYNERSRPGWTPSTSLQKPLSPIRSTMKTITYVPGTFVTLVPGPYTALASTCRWAVRLGQDQFSGVLESGAMRKSELHAIPRITLSQQRLKRRTNKGDASLSWRDRVDRRSVARCPTSTHRAK